MNHEDQWFFSGMIVILLIVLKAAYMTPVPAEHILGEPLASTIFFLYQVMFMGGAIVLLVLVGRGAWKVWVWWKHRASPALPINRVVSIHLSVSNDFDDFKRTKDELKYLLEQKRGPLLTGFLTWLNNKPPRERFVMSIGADHDEPVSSMHQPV